MNDQLANSLSAASTGLQTKDEYKRKREELLQAAALGKLAPAALDTMESNAVDAGTAKKKKKKKTASASVLSFGDELEDESISPRLYSKGMGKDHSSDRETNKTAAAQQAAKQEYLLALEKAKSEPITLPYSFRSEVTQRELPKGVHQGSITTTKGATAESVARLVRIEVETLGEKFKLPEVAGVKDANRELMLVVGAGGQRIGSFIIPSALTLVELLAYQWKEGSSLFDNFKWGITITERRWYEKMKHTFPYSQWAVFDVHSTYSLAEFVANRNSGTGVDPFRKGPR